MKLIRILSEQRRHVGAGKEAFLRVDAKLLTRIDDVEVAHRKLTNTVFGGEHRIALFHDVRETGWPPSVV